MPIGPSIGGPVPNLGAQEIEITDKDGKVIGTEKILKSQPSHSDKVPLYAKIMVVLVVALFAIWLISVFV